MKKTILFAFLAMLLPILANAYDFEKDGIYYNINSDGISVSVTYEDANYNSYSGSVVIPSTVTNNDTGYSVTSIGWDAFRGCSGLTSVTIPNSVTSIGRSAFYGCESLESVTIPDGVTTIEDYTFSYCYKLKSVSIPEGLTSIGRCAFMGCSVLSSVTIPNSVTSISYRAFQYCSGLTSIVIPNGVTSIQWGVFENCLSLTTITIPESVISIGKEAFSGCSGLTSVTIPNSVTSIDRNAFSGCLDLTSVTIGNSVTNIGESAFSDCSGLTKVEFTNIESLCKIKFGNEKANPLWYAKHLYIDGHEVTDLVIPETVTSIGSYVFHNCSGLTSITIPESVTSIGSTFRGCTGLTSITIPNSVTSIGNYAFDGCTALNSITIGNNVESIGWGVFYGCSVLKNVVCKAQTIPTMGSDCFSGMPLSSATLYVPASALDDYKSAEQWKDFGTILPIEDTEPYKPYKPFSTTTAYYLYNKEADLYLCPGNSYDTQASVGEAGMDMLLEDVAGENESFFVGDTQCAAYAVNTRIYNSTTAHYMGMSGDGTSAYFDQESAAWYFVPQEDGTFLLSSNTTGNYLYYDGVHTALAITSDATEKGAKWHVMTREDIIGKMETATADNPVNASSLIEYADFSRNGKLRVGVWQGNPSRGGNNNNFCAEKFDCNFNVYQILTGLPNGVYKVKAQAYYREGADQSYNPTPALELRKNGNEHLYAKLYANNEETSVHSIFDEAGDCIYGYSTELGVVPNSVSHAATAFLQGLYWNELEVNVTDGTLQLGLKKDEYVFYDWTCFDSFRLYYYGPEYILGDANGNGGVEIGDITSVLTLMATPGATGYDNKAADANQNGEIEIGDITTILTIMASGGE